MTPSLHFTGSKNHFSFITQEASFQDHCWPTDPQVLASALRCSPAPPTPASPISASLSSEPLRHGSAQTLSLSLRASAIWTRFPRPFHYVMDPPTALPVQGITPSHEPHWKGSVAGKWLPVAAVHWLPVLWRPTCVSFPPVRVAAALTWLPEVGGIGVGPSCCRRWGRVGFRELGRSFGLWPGGLVQPLRLLCLCVCPLPELDEGQAGWAEVLGSGQLSLESSVLSEGRVDREPRRRRAGMLCRGGSPGGALPAGSSGCDVGVTGLPAAHPNEGSCLHVSALLPRHSSEGLSYRERRVLEP